MKGRFPSLDGWRAVSILLVLGNHTPVMAGFPWSHARFLTTFLDGNLGVRFFFVISGFLITWLMLKEKAELKYVNLKNFYIRRTLRIWPVYIAFLVVLFFLQTMGMVYQTLDAWRGLLTFTRNFHDEVLGSPRGCHQWPLLVASH